MAKTPKLTEVPTELDLGFAQGLREDRVLEVLQPLTTAMRAFAMHMAMDEGNATQCAIKAGYAKKSSGRQANKLLRDDSIVQAINVLRNEIGIAYGCSVRMHRQYFLEMSEDLRKSHPNSAITARTRLAELDGHIGQQNKGGSGITIVQVSTGIDRADITINQQSSVIEADQ